jgi:hypothetical protein
VPSPAQPRPPVPPPPAPAPPPPPLAPPQPPPAGAPDAAPEQARVQAEPVDLTAPGAPPPDEPAEDVPFAARSFDAEADTQPPPPLVYDNALGQLDDDAPSTFEHAPLFRRRRNWGRLGMIAALVFAVVALGAAVALAGFGLPDWLRLGSQQTFAPAQAELVLDFPPNRQDRRTLPNGTEFFGASGKVTNVGKTTRYLPSILIVLRDARGRIVYSWEVVPPKRELAPGESLTINEAVTDVPKSAVAAEIGWKMD